jgi:malate synthase
MWTKPRQMSEMVETKIEHPQAGANTMVEHPDTVLMKGCSPLRNSKNSALIGTDISIWNRGYEYSSRQRNQAAWHFGRR